MDGKVLAYLSGYKGFGRSFNRSVLANDERLHQDYKDALNNGSLPCNRQQIITVGDKGVGKTSTLKYLQGEVCDPSEEPKATEGIEITQCETSEQKSDWVACRDDGSPSSADDPTLSAAWCVCDNIDSFEGILQRKEKDRESTNDSSDQPQNRPMKDTACDGINGAKQAFRWICRSAVTEMQMAGSAIVLFIIACCYFLFDFGVLCWLGLIMCHAFFLKSDFNSAYRFVIPIVFQIIVVEATIRATKFTSGLGVSRPEDRVWAFVVATVLYSGVCGISTCFGLLCGLGCRSGVAIALCIMTPTSKSSMSFDKEVLVLAIGNLCGPLLVRFGMKFVQHMTRSLKEAAASFTVVICIAFTWTGYSGNPYVPVFLLGVFMGFGNAYGVLKGRETVAVKKLMPPYVLKKAFGFVVGIIMGHLIGWRLMFFSETSTACSMFLSTLAAFGFLTYDLLVAQKVVQLEKNAIPITIFRKFLMDSATGDNPVSYKLQLWDNAGGNVYQTMQQFFRPAEAVYLVVFNLEDARKDEKEQHQRLRQWLFSLKAHSERIAKNEKMPESPEPNTLVFIVGTHRDSVTREFIDRFAAQIYESLYTDFCSMLALNDDKGPLYVVENSKPMDKDGLHLQKSVTTMAKKTSHMTEHFPIRNLRILNKIRNRQASCPLPWIISTFDLLQTLEEENLSLEDFHEVLSSLHRTGDVIYREDDEILKGYVVIRPQELMDRLKAIVRIPPRESRSRNLADDWLELETKGIASRNLIQAIAGSVETILAFLRLMEAYNLLIPAYSGTTHQEQCTESCQCLQSGQLPDYCILPSHLPDFTGDEATFWVPSEDDEVYYFDFAHVSPDPIFHRLLAKCCCGRDNHNHLFKTRGRFRYEAADLYAIQLRKVSHSQNTIQVTIQRSAVNNQRSLQVLQHLQKLLEEIRLVDFSGLSYSCGPICSDCSSDDFLMVLRVCGHDEEFPITQIKSFMSHGKNHEVSITPQLMVTCGRRRRRTSSSNSSQGGK
ncbi:uncharacterized protein LOC119723260 [Patiria miniata]|uniref:Uncharacterized protein n=1 Tax=Patiria miniata TaxID=46514 RepID=A0A913ZD97_PATMI|nr:uncharacterized protein LOC119723260 [Patiria miniata]